MATVQFQYMQVTSAARPASQAPLHQEKGVTYVQESRPHSLSEGCSSSQLYPYVNESYLTPSHAVRMGGTPYHDSLFALLATRTSGHPPREYSQPPGPVSHLVSQTHQNPVKFWGYISPGPHTRG